MRSPNRSRSGSAMTEVGPGLIILLLFIFWPAIDLVSMLVSYCFVKVLNTNQVHEASLIPFAEAQSPSGAIQKIIPDQWRTGLGKYIRVVGQINTRISYRNGQQSSDDGASSITDKTVVVSTTVKCEPMLPIPMFVAQVPGLNAPMTLTITADRPMENADNAP